MAVSDSESLWNLRIRACFESEKEIDKLEPKGKELKSMQKESSTLKQRTEEVSLKRNEKGTAAGTKIINVTDWPPMPAVRAGPKVIRPTLEPQKIAWGPSGNRNNRASDHTSTPPSKAGVKISPASCPVSLDAVMRTLDKFPSETSNSEQTDDTHKQSQESYRKKHYKSARQRKKEAWEKEKLDRLFAQVFTFRLPKVDARLNDFDGVGIDPFQSEARGSCVGRKPFQSSETSASSRSCEIHDKHSKTTSRLV